MVNEQKPPGGIEWTRIEQPVERPPIAAPPYGAEVRMWNTRRGYTWNPTAGCHHGCTWRMPNGNVIECYAKTVAEGVARHAYPDGFEHHYWNPQRLSEPLRVKHPAGIFVGSMADLFGHWTPDEQIDAVFNTMRRANWHIFQTLSKYPNRLASREWPQNVWAGVSLPAGHLMSESGGARALSSYLRHMRHINARTRFMSIEPLWFDVAPVLKQHAVRFGSLPFEWAIIGAASDGPRLYQPDPDWVIRLHTLLAECGVPVFHKGNLRWPETRREFPTV